jgi:protein kinase A
MGILLYEMNVGIDPFNDEDPMMIYQKILKGKIRFPSFFDR